MITVKYNILPPPENMTPQSKWLALWVPSWYALDQSLIVGQTDEYHFLTVYSSWLQECFSERQIPTPALVFENDHRTSREEAVYALKGKILRIQNSRFGSIQRLVNKGFDYEMVLESGETYTINSEEEPGAIWDEANKTWLKSSQEYDWSMLVRFQILDRDPHGVFDGGTNVRQIQIGSR